MSKSDGGIIQILYTSFSRRLTREEWEKKRRCLPEQTQARVMRYQRWQDRQAKMFGYFLLKKGLQNYGYALNCDIHKDRFGRPYVNYGIDFNISDSDGCVVCALTSYGRLGIDIEKIKPIDFAGFRNCMSPLQWKQIEESKNMYASFFKFWTIKESTLKADGRGLAFPLDKVEVFDNKAVLEGKSWFLTNLAIQPDTCCHLACDMENRHLEIKEIDFTI